MSTSGQVIPREPRAERRERGAGPDHAAAEAPRLRILAVSIPAFALCRRANGLAFARWKQGDVEGGAALARRACEHAGDGGHLRLRAMALQMVARIAGGPEGEEAQRRAMEIATSLADEALRMRLV